MGSQLIKLTEGIVVSPAQPLVQMKAATMEEKHIIALIPSLSYWHALCFCYNEAFWGCNSARICLNVLQLGGGKSVNGKTLFGLTKKSRLLFNLCIHKIMYLCISYICVMCLVLILCWGFITSWSAPLCWDFRALVLLRKQACLAKNYRILKLNYHDSRLLHFKLYCLLVGWMITF